MKIEVLRELAVLVQRKSFRQAAKELYLSQPTLSAHIAALEQEIGFCVIERSTSTFQVTPAGVAFLESALPMLEIYNEAIKRGKELSTQGAPLRMLSTTLNETQRQALAKMPQLRAKPVGIPYNITPTDALVQGLVDLTNIPDPNSNKVVRAKLEGQPITWVSTEPYACSIAVDASNVLACKHSITRDDLRGATVSIGGYAYIDEHRETVKAILGDDLGLRFQARLVDSIAELSFDDLGETIHICAKDKVERYYGFRGCKVFDKVDDKPLLCMDVLAYRTDVISPQQAELIDLLSAT